MKKWKGNHKSKLTKNVLMIIFLLMSSSFLYSFQIATAQSSNMAGNSSLSSPCKCVIFRLDDIQVGYLDHVQEQIIDLFQQKHASITIGIIGHDFYNDKVVLPYLKQQLKNNSSQIEIANHGWMHEDFSRYNITTQEDLMNKTNNEVSSLFGINPIIFIPPFNEFNDDTLISAHRLGFKIFSSSIFFDNSNYLVSDNEKTSSINSQLVYHMPSMVDFSAIPSGKWTRIPNEKILNVVESDITKYGYSVILLHPENFAMLEGQSYLDVLDLQQTNDLSNLIDSLRSKNVQITTFSNVAGLGNINTMNVVPEFGQSASFIIVIAVAGVVMLSKVGRNKMT